MAQAGQETTSLRQRMGVHPLPFSGGDAALVRAVAEHHPGAIAHLHARFAGHVRGVLLRVLGFDQDLADAQHDTFLRALQSIGELRDPEALKPWLTSVAVFTARTWIQRRQRQRWLRFLPSHELPEVEAPPACGEAREALRATYTVLEGMPVDERLAFSLHYIEGLEVREVAAACRVPLSTMKRRLERAEARFRKRARQHPVLHEWVPGGPP